MTSSSSSTKIQELKDKITNIKNGLEKQEMLRKKRSELENILLENQVKGQYALLRAHQAEFRALGAAVQLFEKANDHEALGKELIQRLRCIDKEMDSWEELDEKDLGQLQTFLAESILKSNPSQKEYFESLKSKQFQWKKIKQQNDQLIELLGNIEHLLLNLQLARARIRKQGILSYIFGANPNMIVAQCLKGISEILQKEKPTILTGKKDFSDVALPSLINELSIYTEELEQACQKKWDFKRLDVLLEKNFSKIQHFKDHFEKCREEILSRLNNLEEELESWLSLF
ncbi:hypothetical protein PHSC3_000658 [Chlamydiales bacterium STE3]|nr:hypothetical protein PHSC3_000658 [Chlamydiales bacterium STE3]